MNLETIVQEFTHEDSGEVERITAEPLEFYTEAGWEIIPAGFRFRFSSPRWLRLSDQEKTACVLYEWHRTARNRPRWAAVRILRRNLINYTAQRQNATSGRFWGFVRGRARAEALAVMIPVCWLIFR